MEEIPFSATSLEGWPTFPYPAPQGMHRYLTRRCVLTSEWLTPALFLVQVAKTDAPPKEEGEGSVEGTMLRDTAANLTTPVPSPSTP